MEQDVETGYSSLCCTCLSSNRDLFSINSTPQVFQIFRLLMYDFAGDRLGDSLPDQEQLVCWECLALMRRFLRFKWQVHSAQDHLRVISLSRTQECVDHSYMSQSLSSLEISTKKEYDKIFFDYSAGSDEQRYISISSVQTIKNEQYDVLATMRDSISMTLDDHMLEVPIVLENPVTGVMSHIVVGTDALVSSASADCQPTESKAPDSLPFLTIAPLNAMNSENKFEISQKHKQNVIQEEYSPSKSKYVVETMTEEEMTAHRESAKLKVQYASSVYKCELCIVGFYTQQQVEDHFENSHRSLKPGQSACKVCYMYVDDGWLATHENQHYLRYSCKLCGHKEYGVKFIQYHVSTHMTKSTPSAVIKMGDSKKNIKKPNHYHSPTYEYFDQGTTEPSNDISKKKKDKGKDNATVESPPKPGDLRKLLSKITIQGYQCLECDMLFKTSRARKNHVAKCHREGFQCDHCKKRFVNRTTLTTHLRLHEGPLPREECPICHKMVRVIQLKYHIQRHQNKSRYECTDCDKVFSHVATYQAHLKFSRAHAQDNIFKYPCPMCNKGYPTKEAMQDHFNYQHLGKTSHKCPVCQKPIATRANVERHIMRVHGEKKDKPRNHVCLTCGKGFTDRKALTQHEVIHSGERPLSCELCQQTFKQKASLYTHKKRVHKIVPSKRIVEYMDTKPNIDGGAG